MRVKYLTKVFKFLIKLCLACLVWRKRNKYLDNNAMLQTSGFLHAYCRDATPYKYISLYLKTIEIYSKYFKTTLK